MDPEGNVRSYEKTAKETILDNTVKETRETRNEEGKKVKIEISKNPVGGITEASLNETDADGRVIQAGFAGKKDGTLKLDSMSWNKIFGNPDEKTDED